MDLEDRCETLLADPAPAACEDTESAERLRIVARHVAAVAEHQRCLAELERRLPGCNG